MAIYVVDVKQLNWIDLNTLPFIRVSEKDGRL